MQEKTWWAAVYGVVQSRTRLKRLSSILNPPHCFRPALRDLSLISSVPVIYFNCPPVHPEGLPASYQAPDTLRPRRPRPMQPPPDETRRDAAEDTQWSRWGRARRGMVRGGCGRPGWRQLPPAAPLLRLGATYLPAASLPSRARFPSARSALYSPGRVLVWAQTEDPSGCGAASPSQGRWDPDSLRPALRL